MKTFRLALVTGASSGIGKATATLLAERGIHLLLTGRNSSALNALATDLRQLVNVVVYPFDLASSTQRKLLIEKIRELAPDLVINNAGIGVYGDAINVDFAKILEMIEVDVTALTEITVEAAKMMVSTGQPGIILNVSSVAGFFPFPAHAVYGASKAYVNSFSLALDAELKERKIRVLAACPGVVNTAFSERASGRKRDQTGMSPRFAAEQIWKQIVIEKPLHVFDWKYKLFRALSVIVPRWWVNRILRQEIKSRL